MAGTHQPRLVEAPVRSPTTGAFLDFIVDGEREGAIGRSVTGLSHEEIHIFQKELANKLAWAMGTFFKVPYSGNQTVVKKYVERVSRAILRDHGYPA